jgi:hypothetical protein
VGVSSIPATPQSAARIETDPAIKPRRTIPATSAWTNAQCRGASLDDLAEPDWLLDDEAGKSHSVAWLRRIATRRATLRGDVRI